MKRLLGLTLFALAALGLMAVATKKPTYNIYMIGDSTMADKDLSKGTPERGWGMVLGGFFTSAVRIENHSVNGRSTKSFIDEGRWQVVLDRLQPGDYVIIQFGHNDEKDDPKRHTDVGGSFDDNLRRFVRETRSKGAIPVLMNAVERRSFYDNKIADDGKNIDDEKLRDTKYAEERVNTDRLVPSHGEYAEAPRRVAQEQNVIFIDATAISNRMENAWGIEGSRTLHMWLKPGECPSVPDGRQDNTHYNVLGAHVIASLLVDAIGDAIPELKPFVRHYDYIVSAEGRGNFMTLQEAVDAVPSGKKTDIYVLDGSWSKPVLKGKKVRLIYK